jgi:hypothetical protein
MDSKKRITRNEVMAIKSPEYTKTWSPISHYEVIRSLDAVMKEKGVGIRKESYSVKNDGKNMFGTWVLDIEKNGKLLQVGFRNSISKNFAVGICAGVYVIACSNMQFRGDAFIEFRKHTSGISYEELLRIEYKAFDQVIEQGNNLIKWQESLHKFKLDDNKLKCITYDALDQGIIPPNKFKAFQDAHTAELELVKSKNGNLYTFHGAVTRMNNSLNLFTASNRTTDLYNLCNEYMN